MANAARNGTGFIGTSHAVLSGQDIAEIDGALESGIRAGLSALGIKQLSAAGQAHLIDALESLHQVLAECVAPEATPVTGTDEPAETKAQMAKRVFSSIICPFTR